MRPRWVRAPESLLLNSELCPSAKVVWLLCMLPPGLGLRDEKVTDAGSLAARSGLSCPTTRKAVTQLIFSGWCTSEVALNHSPRDATAVFPRDLLLEHQVCSEAKVLYGVLQLTPQYQYPDGRFSYADLTRMTGSGRNTIKRALAQLGKAGWATGEQENMKDYVYFTLLDPTASLRSAVIAQAALRIRHAPSTGEGLMREWLSLLALPSYYQDGGTDGRVINPLTGMPLQFDRSYPPAVAFEYNGSQHEAPSERFSPQEVAAQQARDLMKQGACARLGIKLIIVTADDLSLKGMLKKVDGVLPLRPIKENEPLLDYLEARSQVYRAAAREGAATDRPPKR
ncbi:MAG: hypothetical protein ACM3XM_06455 [Mycobacterium leprae]